MASTTSDPITAPIGRPPYPRRRVAALWVLAPLLLISAFAVLGKPPYDDEIINFHYVEGKDLASIIHTSNSEDVHPPGSYVINAFLYHLFGSWDRVKAFGGCLNALALSFFLWLAYDKVSDRQRIWLIGMLATASTIVLWGASVRWYAYFNPLFTMTFAIIAFTAYCRAGDVFLTFLQSAGAGRAVVGERRIGYISGENGAKV
jgi:hypothetical protein